MKLTQTLKVFIALLISIYSVNVTAQTRTYALHYDFEGDKREKVVIRSNDNQHSIRVSSWDYDLRYSGYFTISDNDKDILSISPNGYLEVSRTSFGNVRKLSIRSDADGKLTKKYIEGSREGSYEKEGAQWLADILPDIVRRTGVGAEHRVQSIYNKKGISGVLEEIDEIDSYSGAVRNLYFVILVDNIKLSDSELAKVIPELEIIKSNSTKGTLMREILSKYDLSIDNTVKLLQTTSSLDYNTERAAVLRLFNTQLVEDSRIMYEYFDIIEDMSINSEKGNVLKHLMHQNKLQDETYIALFESLESFSLEREKGAVLLSAIPTMPNSENVLEKFIETVEDMSSSYYVLKGEIMNKLVDYQSGGGATIKGNKTIILQLLSTAMDYSSNSQKGLTLRKVNNMFVADQEVISMYKSCVESISDRIEQYNVVLDLLEKQKLDKKGYEMVLDMAEDLVDADYQHAAGAVLRNAIINMPEDDELIHAYFGVVKDMDQNCTIEEIIRTVNEVPGFKNNDQVIIKSIESLEQMSVDIEKTTVLLLLQPQIKTKEQKLAYSYTVKEIKSDYLKRKVAL